MKITKYILSLTILLITIGACTQPEGNYKLDLADVLKNGEVSTEYGISYAGQPSEAEFKIFANSGYTTIIDLKGVKEDRGLDEQAVVESLGMKYISLPIEDEKAISFNNAKKLDTLIANAEGPILLHCGSSNRVGALLTLRESLKGVDDATALTIGKMGGLTNLKPVVLEVLKNKN